MLEIEMAIQAVKATREVVTGAFKAKVDQESKAIQIEVQSNLLELQEHLINATQERMELVRELEEVRRKLRVMEDAQAKLDAYYLVDMGGEAMLYRSKGEGVAHYACPACYAGGKISVLQERKTGHRQTHYACSVCKFQRTVGPDDPINYDRGGHEPYGF